jgi:hypothetical protein
MTQVERRSLCDYFLECSRIEDNTLRFQGRREQMITVDRSWRSQGR